MKSIRIDYHSGTGGTMIVAKLLAKKLQALDSIVELNRITRDKMKGVSEMKSDYYILVFPVHSFCAPKPVYEWAKHFAGNQCKTAVISVSGGGDVLSNSACRQKTIKLLKENNFNVIFEEMIQMPNNWMKAPAKERCMRILSNLPQKIDTLAQAIFTEKKKKKVIYWIDYLISAFGEIEKIATRKFGRRISVSENCSGCGLCAKNCCSSNITMGTSATLLTHPIFGDRCDMCLGCIYNCPQKALKPTYGAFQIDKNGYDLSLMCQSANLQID